MEAGGGRGGWGIIERRRYGIGVGFRRHAWGYFRLLGISMADERQWGLSS